MTKNGNTMPTQKKVRVIEVLVQPILVIDDGIKLERVEQAVITIPAAEWATYSNERFPAELAAWENQLNGGPPSPPTSR